MRRVLVAVAAIMGAICAPVEATVIFDNGPFSGTQIGRFNSSIWTMFDDFQLTSNETITGFRWAQHDHISTTYSQTTLSIFNGLPSAGTLLHSINVVAARTANATGTLFGEYDGFDYEVSGLNFSLGPGIYFLGLHNDLTNGATTWDETIGNAFTIPGRYQSGSPLNAGSFHGDEDSVFQVVSDSEPVPEPTTLFLLGSGIVGLVARRRR